MEKKKKPIKMNFPPEVVIKYTKGWAEEATKHAKSDADKAMISDILTMVEVAKSVMVTVEGKK